MLVLGVVCVFSSERKSREGGRVNLRLTSDEVSEKTERMLLLRGSLENSLP